MHMQRTFESPSETMAGRIAAKIIQVAQVSGYNGMVRPSDNEETG